MEKIARIVRKDSADGSRQRTGMGRSLKAGIHCLLLLAPLVAWNAALAQDTHGHGPSADPMDMDGIVVTAERIDAFVETNPQQVVVLRMDEILDRNILSVEEALNSMAGVDVKKSAGIGSRISIRGLGKSGGVLVLLNGRPLNSSQ